MSKFINVVTRTPKRAVTLLPYAEVVVQCLTGNPNFPNIDVTKLKDRIKTLKDAQIGATNKQPGGASTCLAARQAVRQEIAHLRDDVQTVLEEQAGTADIDAIRGMAESAAMDLRKVSARARQAFAVMYGPDPGSVKLTAEASRKRDTHEWQVSTDQIHWSALPSTRQARTTVTGLPIGVAHFFRHRLVTKSGYSDWSDPVLMIVVK